MIIHFQYFSNLYLKSIDDIPDIKPNRCQQNKNFVCILAGNIGNLDSDIYWNFLTKLDQEFNHVFVVFGKYEIESCNSLESLLITIKQVKSFSLKKTRFLINSSVTICNINIVGICFKPKDFSSRKFSFKPGLYDDDISCFYISDERSEDGNINVIVNGSNFQTSSTHTLSRETNSLRRGLRLAGASVSCDLKSDIIIYSQKDILEINEKTNFLKSNPFTELNPNFDLFACFELNILV